MINYEMNKNSQSFQVTLGCAQKDLEQEKSLLFIFIWLVGLFSFCGYGRSYFHLCLFRNRDGCSQL